MIVKSRWKKILVPTDLSPLSQRAIEQAHALAELHESELHVLHVARDAKEMLAQHGVVGTIEPGETSESTEWLAALLGESGTVRRVEVSRISDDPSASILEYSTQEEIELIVIATHGRTGIPHLILGSIAEQLIRTASCPVLVIPPEKD